MKKFFLAACAALIGSCGSPPENGDGGVDNRQREQCVGDACATLRVVVSRPARLRVDDADFERFTISKLHEPGQPWVVRVPAPDVYIVSAEDLEGGEGLIAAPNQPVSPGDDVTVHCTFDADRAETKAVPMTFEGVDGAVPTMDGIDITLTDGNALVPLDRFTHVYSGRKDHYTGSEFEVNTAATMPERITVELGYDPNWYCTETVGPEAGTPAAESGPIRAVAQDGHVVLLGLPDGDIQIVGTALYQGAEDPDKHGEGVLNLVTTTITMRYFLRGEQYLEVSHACRLIE